VSLSAKIDEKGKDYDVLSIPVMTFCGRSGSDGVDASFKQAGGGGGRCVMAYLIQGESVSLIPQNFLGFSKPGTATTIQRYRPMQCPLFPELYATEISGLKLLGKATIDSKGAPTADAALVHIVFTSPKWELGNDSAKDESQRWTIMRATTETNFVTRDDVRLLYKDGPYASNTKPVPGNNTSWGQRVQKVKLAVQWFEVPGTYVCDAWGIPTNILACVGTVNVVAFLGRSANTCLIEGFDLEPMEFAVAPSLVGARGLVSRGFNVTLHVTYFDPPTHDTVQGRVGHLGLPLPADPQARWVTGQVSYTAPNGQNVLGPLYASTDHNECFQQRK